MSSPEKKSDLLTASCLIYPFQCLAGSKASPTTAESSSSIIPRFCGAFGSANSRGAHIILWTLKKHGCEAILVNNNPETVSTDFDTGDRLYFDPLNPESVDNIIATEKPDACVVQFGGQTAIKLAKHMDEIGLPILGTPADAIDEAEDRERFDELLERCKIPRAPGRTVFNLDEALAAADEIGLPVLMRPSYVLGGQNMIVAYTKADVIEYMGVITEHVDMDHPVLLDKYLARFFRTLLGS